MLCLAISKEMIKSIERLLPLLGKCAIFSEILLSISQCPAYECRLLLTACLPVLIWTEWRLQSSEEEEGFHETVCKLLLAIDRQAGADTRGSMIRMPSIASPSIYHAKGIVSSEREATLFPRSVTQEESISLEVHRPIESLTPQTRLLLIRQLSQRIHEHLVNLPEESLIAYAVLMDRLATLRTPLAQGQVRQVLAGEKSPTLTAQASNISLMNLLEKTSALSLEPRPEHNMATHAWAIDLFYQHYEVTSRFPLRDPHLACQWATSLACLQHYYPDLVAAVQASLLERCRYEGLSKAILALR